MGPSREWRARTPHGRPGKVLPTRRCGRVLQSGGRRTDPPEPDRTTLRPNGWRGWGCRWAPELCRPVHLRKPCGCRLHVLRTFLAEHSRSELSRALSGELQPHTSKRVPWTDDLVGRVCGLTGTPLGAVSGVERGNQSVGLCGRPQLR